MIFVSIEYAYEMSGYGEKINSILFLRIFLYEETNLTQLNREHIVSASAKGIHPDFQLAQELSDTFDHIEHFEHHISITGTVGPIS
jgi:hypothetical protein